MHTSHRIGVIDDDPSFRAAMMDFLRSLGHRAEGFASVEAFFASGDARRFACLLSDIDLPGIGGLELPAMLARTGSLVPVVLMSGRTDPALTRRAAERGACGFLPKPCEAVAIIRCLDTATGRG